MKTRTWRRVAAVPLLALAATSLARAAEEPAAPSGRTFSPPRIDAAPEPQPANSWLRVPEVLQAFGIESWWDVVQFGPWSGALGLSFDDHEQQIKSPASADQHYSSRVADQTLSIRNDGFAIVDPRLLTGTFGVGLTVEQEWQDANGVASKQNGTLTNYDFELTALRDSPYNLSVFANQSQSTYVLPSGTTTHADLLNRGVTLRLREDNILRDREILPYFSSTVRAVQQYDKQTTSNAGQSFVQDNRRDLVALDVHNGTETSDLGVQYQYARLENFAYRPGSYQSQAVNAVYSTDFGPTLNWRSDSRINYNVRNGRDPLSDLTNLEVNEFLTIDHDAELSSNYNYQLTRQDTPFGSSSTQSLGAQVNKQFYSNFSGTAAVNGLYSSLPGGKIASAGTSASVGYSHRLPWSGNLYANAGGGYAVTSTQVAAGFVQVTDAPYQVPDPVGAGASILLNDRNVVASSIQVIVVKGGTRVAAILDVDYTVRVDGDRTSILPSATSAVMLPGDRLEISYHFQVSPDSKFQTVSNSASLGADWTWFGFGLSHDQSRQSPIGDGDAALLVNEQRDSARLYLRGIWDGWQARAGMGYTRYDSSRLAYREARLDQFLSYLPLPTLQLNLAGEEYRTEYDLPAHTTIGASIRVDVQWNYRAWLTTAYAGWRTYRDTQQPSERVVDAGLRIRRSWTKLDVSLAAGLQQRQRAHVDSLNAIVHVGIVRRF